MNPLDDPDQICDRYDMKMCTAFTPLPPVIREKTGVAFFSIFKDVIYLVSRNGNQIGKVYCEFPISMAQPTLVSLCLFEGKMYLPDYTRDQMSTLNGIIPKTIDKCAHDLDTTHFFVIDNHVYYFAMEQDDNQFRAYEIHTEREEKRLFGARYYNFPGNPTEVCIKNDHKAIYKVVKQGENFIDTKLFDFISIQSPPNFMGVMMFWGFEECYAKLAVLNLFCEFKDTLSKGDYQEIMTDKLHNVTRIGEYGLTFPNYMLKRWFGADFIPRRDAVLKQYYQRQWAHPSYDNNLIIEQIREMYGKMYIKEDLGKKTETDSVYEQAKKYAIKAYNEVCVLEQGVDKLTMMFIQLMGLK